LLEAPSTIWHPGVSARQLPDFKHDSMITSHERQALSEFAANIYKFGCSSDAVIVDAGTYLGASTTALADGLHRSGLAPPDRRGRIWCYDLFVATPEMVAAGQPLSGSGIDAGGTFRKVFDEMTADVRDYLTVHEGDIRLAPAPDVPISVLFLDVMWSYEAAHDISSRFYPLLEAERSVLIQQDFIYPFYPWVPIHMGLMQDCFSAAYDVPLSSMVFDVTKVPSSIPDARDVSYPRAREIYEHWIDLAPRWGKGVLWLGFALYSASVSRFDEAQSIIREVEERYSDETLVVQYFTRIKNYCALAAGSATPPPPVGGS